MPVPNLFKYATSELSQDAFVCWLADWAAPDCRDADEGLHRVACLFLDRLIEAGRQRKPDRYTHVCVHRQHRNIDVVIEVNSDLVVVIEDKTNTREHSGQLPRYLAIAAEDFRGRNVAPVYLKTGDQGAFRRVNEAHYGRFLRADFLAVLEADVESKITNCIFADFYQHLREVEDAVQSFRTAALSQWDEDWQRWYGFFTALQSEFPKGEWETVSNRRGGFVGFRWHWVGNKFLQLENNRLAFKIEVVDPTRQAAERDAWQAAVLTRSGQDGINLEKTTRRTGTWMTVAQLQEDYRQSSAPDGPIDFDRTLDTLRKAERLMDAALAGGPADGTT